ncbi:regulatory iron-sulfur-containing complex subunit RicT [uncultured Butyricimonas sp.]|uniref:PSP1 domain-containing protein n=1 Tax=uncultured Butyricimonas sp. TaxID=1268785 RepID=UPI0026DC5CE1|nr:regulatory iron-sulfur-containing complex subunit RicT [uncultured Butyricimonas sp.]
MSEITEDKQENIENKDIKQHPTVVPVIDHRLLAGKLTVYNWMQDIPEGCTPSDIVEVRFKNTRKGFFLNNSNLKLNIGDIVAVEAALGHDIGIVSLTGELVKEQMQLKRVDLERNPLKKVYRKAKPHDIEKWQQAIALEHDTMIRSRIIAADLNLDMKIGDVEYQGDKTKAIFYYIANDRVDFRKLIKILAETFHIRIEMKQIGARQEAGRIGGIGSCGRKLCCSTFITNFISVSTSAARYQDISLNPQKLAGQCGKLKCCLNYEVDAYIDEQKDFPSSNVWLNTGEGMLYHQKTDIFGRNMSYSFDKEGRGALIKLPVARVKEIIALNKKGIIPAKALEIDKNEAVNIKYTDGVGEESLNRFDEKKEQGGRRRNRNRNRRNPQKENNNEENKPREKDVNASGEKAEKKTLTKNENRPGNRQDNRQGNNRPNNRQGNNRNPRRQGSNQNNRPENKNNNKPENKENNKPAEQ